MWNLTLMSVVIDFDTLSDNLGKNVIVDAIQSTNAPKCYILKKCIILTFSIFVLLSVLSHMVNSSRYWPISAYLFY